MPPALAGKFRRPRSLASRRTCGFRPGRQRGDRREGAHRVLQGHEHRDRRYAAAEALATVDEDGSGELEFDEFVELIDGYGTGKALAPWTSSAERPEIRSGGDSTQARNEETPPRFKNGGLALRPRLTRYETRSSGRFSAHRKPFLDERGGHGHPWNEAWPQAKVHGRLTAQAGRGEETRRGTVKYVKFSTGVDDDQHAAIA